MGRSALEAHCKAPLLSEERRPRSIVTEADALLSGPLVLLRQFHYSFCFTESLCWTICCAAPKSAPGGAWQKGSGTPPPLVLRRHTPDTLTARIGPAATGRACSAFRAETAGYFRWHREDRLP